MLYKISTPEKDYNFRSLKTLGDEMKRFKDAAVLGALVNKETFDFVYAVMIAFGHEQLREVRVKLYDPTWPGNNTRSYYGVLVTGEDVRISVRALKKRDYRGN
jgi:hypothetical protein